MLLNGTYGVSYPVYIEPLENSKPYLEMFRMRAWLATRVASLISHRSASTWIKRIELVNPLMVTAHRINSRHSSAVAPQSLFPLGLLML